MHLTVCAKRKCIWKISFTILERGKQSEKNRKEANGHKKIQKANQNKERIKGFKKT